MGIPKAQVFEGLMCVPSLLGICGDGSQESQAEGLLLSPWH